MTIQIHHFTITKAKLGSIPDAERNLLVLLGHSANEIGILSKLFHFCSADNDEHELLAKAQYVQAVLFGRLVTGKIYEFWNLLQTGYFGTRLSKEYHELLDTEAVAALDAMKKYFGADNLIKRVRDTHAFHYDVNQILDGHRTLDEQEPLHVYLSRRHVNSLYAFADTIAGRAMLECIQPGDHPKAFEMLVQDTSSAIGWVNEVTGALMETCFRRYLGGNLYALGAKTIEIDGAPWSQVVRIPYFIEVRAEDEAEVEP